MGRQKSIYGNREHRGIQAFSVYPHHWILKFTGFFDRWENLKIHLKKKNPKCQFQPKILVTVN